METAVVSVGSIMTVVHSTLITSIVTVRDDPLREVDGWVGVTPLSFSPLSALDLIVKTTWITVSDTPLVKGNQPGAPNPFSVAATTGSSIVVSLETPQQPDRTSSIPALTQSEIPTVASQLGADHPFFTGNPCPPKTDPISKRAPRQQQRSSYAECQQTIAPGGICCMPFQAAPSNPPSTEATSTPGVTVTFLPSSEATSDAGTTVWGDNSFSTVTTDMFSMSTPLSSSSTNLPISPSPPSSPVPSSSAPPPSASVSSSASNPSSSPSLHSTTNPVPANQPTDLTTPHTPMNILPIIIPCALVALGILACAIWCIPLRGNGKRPIAPSPMAPKIMEGKKVFKAGNFATAEALRIGAEEMEKKEGGGKKWAKGGYRKYRDSRVPGSGLLGGKTCMRGEGK
ncbi:hypothetical protein BU23DRAFT_566886 [Bimuria novae-zelandiae CBS 107.79]|uniref:Uncharacterized protein n=1 Tax=Bimuria novae-zelandiae CBS 107.79 TaxID=1447943 RepID=A0A6A5VE11_9PLEO|nr:hypothetical protein BU23DRAFT_566886 [Bimuria novae-zelandiae CBS 107.79]